MNTKSLLPILAIAVLIFSCVPKALNNDTGSAKDPLDEGYSIIFFTIDNYALIYVNDKLAVDTRDLNAEQNDEVLIDLNPYISSSNSTIKIEGYNTECNSCQVNNYEFVYELYRDGEGLEYVSEYSNHKHQPVGLRFTREHKLSAF